MKNTEKFASLFGASHIIGITDINIQKLFQATYVSKQEVQAVKTKILSSLNNGFASTTNKRIVNAIASEMQNISKTTSFFSANSHLMKIHKDMENIVFKKYRTKEERENYIKKVINKTIDPIILPQQKKPIVKKEVQEKPITGVEKLFFDAIRAGNAIGMQYIDIKLLHDSIYIDMDIYANTKKAILKKLEERNSTENNPMYKANKEVLEIFHTALIAYSKGKRPSSNTQQTLLHLHREVRMLNDERHSPQTDAFLCTILNAEQIISAPISATNTPAPALNAPVSEKSIDNRLIDVMCAGHIIGMTSNDIFNLYRDICIGKGEDRKNRIAEYLDIDINPVVLANWKANKKVLDIVAATLTEFAKANEDEPADKAKLKRLYAQMKDSVHKEKYDNYSKESCDTKDFLASIAVVAKSSGLRNVIANKKAHDAVVNTKE